MVHVAGAMAGVQPLQKQTQIPSMQPIQQQLQQQLQQQKPPLQAIKHDDLNYRRPTVEKRNSVSAQTDPIPGLKKQDCNNVKRCEDSQLRDRRQSVASKVRKRSVLLTSLIISCA